MRTKIHQLDRLVGQHCKFVLKELGDERARVVTGTIHEIDYDAGFIIVKSYDGFGCLNFESIMAIKPKELIKNT